MKKHLTALAIATVVLSAGAAGADDGHKHREDNASHELHEVMVESSKKAPAMEMSGDVDKDFAQMMASHHRTGVKMAEIEAKSGKDPELKALAKKIVAAQKEELEVLEKHAGKSHS